MNKSRHDIRYFVLLAVLLATLIKVFAALPGEEHISSKSNITTRSNAIANASVEEAYFMVDVLPRRETFTIKLTDTVKIQKAREIINGNDKSTPHVAGTIVKKAACYNPPWSFHLDPESIDFFAQAIEVCDASIAYTESFLDEAGGHFLPGNHWCPWGSRLIKEVPAPDCNNGVTSVSAANYRRMGLASESIVTAFGNGLATATESAITLPLPTSLAGTTVKITDVSGKELLAPLFFVSPTQVNYQIPTGVEPGIATVTVTNSLGNTAIERTQILTIAPGVFTAAASGQGVPAALALRIKADGSQQYEPVARFDQTQNRFVPVEIDLGASSDQVFLVIFGTGMRYADKTQVDARIGDLIVEVAYIGVQPDFDGLDQINLWLPRQLIRRGEVAVDLMVDDMKANQVVVAIK